MAAVQEAVQNCINMLSGTAAPVGNSDPLGQGGQYAFPARTAAEIQASVAEAAHSGVVSNAREQQLEQAQQAEVALANGQVDMFELLQKQAGLQDPASQGMPPSEVKIDEQRIDDWIL